jgi:hypothetical protein
MIMGGASSANIVPPSDATKMGSDSGHMVGGGGLTNSRHVERFLMYPSVLITIDVTQ